MANDSKPTLFINTVSEIHESTDVPKNKKVYLNRLEDIHAMLLYQINILCEIKTKNTLYEGVVIEVTDKVLKLKIDKDVLDIPISSIEDINILKL